MIEKKFDFNHMLGYTLKSVEIHDDEDQIVFTTEGGEKYELSHETNCCERVWIEDICGDLDDLIGSTILRCEEACSLENPSNLSSKVKKDQEQNEDDGFMWTFYKIDTAKGGVTIRWYGVSNGHYSVSVNFSKF